MDRITQKDLEILRDRINKATNSPLEPYSKDEPTGRLWSNVDHYHLDYAYGGVKLARMVNQSGGITVISTGGYGTKRELYNWMQAFLAGLSA
jgi:hypothetical protein